MSAHLLAWNPNRWEWDDLPDVVAAFENGETLTKRWSCARNKSIGVGDRVFLIRLGKQPKGIFGYGTVITPSYEDVHWEDTRRKSQYVEFQIDWIVLPGRDRIIPRAELDKPPYLQMHWDTQVSGIRIPDDIATALRNKWELIDGETRFALPEEVDASESFSAGGCTLVTVNSYERNPRARQACISHYGARCSVCDLNFTDVYGPVGNGFIHVHHIALVSTKRQKYRLNPIKDLRPVCPNCHAMIHQQEPCLTVNEVKRMIRKQRS